MKKFKQFDKEEQPDDSESMTRDSLINTIANALNRSGGKDDQKNVLMLIAALGLLNLSKESNLALTVARKLANIRR